MLEDSVFESIINKIVEEAKKSKNVVEYNDLKKYFDDLDYDDDLEEKVLSELEKSYIAYILPNSSSLISLGAGDILMLISF